MDYSTEPSKRPKSAQPKGCMDCLSPSRSSSPSQLDSEKDDLKISEEAPRQSIAEPKKSVASGARYLSTGFSLIGYTFCLQLGLHLMTFLLNGLAYRRLDMASIGLVNLRIGLFYSTFMFLARDALRRAFLSRGGELVADGKPATETSGSGCDRFSKLINSAWTVVPLGILVSGLLLFIWIYILPSPGDVAVVNDESHLFGEILQKRYVSCLLVYALSGLLELATEPFWLTCQLSHMIRERIFIEAFANAVRATGLVIAILYVNPKYAIYTLALPQILHGTTLFLVYNVFFYSLFKRNPEKVYQRLEGVRTFCCLYPRLKNFSVDEPAMKLARNLFTQGLLKQLLTEGERYLISGFHLLTFTDQAIYDLVNNLGSIATRLLFLPMEESCHFVFNQCLNRELRPYQQNRDLMHHAFRLLRTVLRVCSLTAWIGLTFAQGNSRLLLFAYAGPKLSENTLACGMLRLYAAYVLLLAWNGSTEAFLNAAMSVDEIKNHNRRLVLFSVIFLCANWVFVPRFGARGFLLANGINMLCRIYFSCSYIERFSLAASVNELSHQTSSTVTHSSGFQFRKLMLPSIRESSVLFISLAISVASESTLCCDSGWLSAAFHAFTSAILLLATLFVIYRDEGDLITVLRSDLGHLKSE